MSLQFPIGLQHSTRAAMAKHKRTKFTDKQRAVIYERDRATCAFSGISLWLLDNGVSPERQIDWVDHLKPSARGGASTLENGACVSDTFNVKKRDNGSDNVCFFSGGAVTREYVRVFGLPKADVLDDLASRRNIVESDWWFNRAIANTYSALDCRVREDRGFKPHKRDVPYWMRSATKRHSKWLRCREGLGFASRQLDRPDVFGADLVLALEYVSTESQYREWLESLWPCYRATAATIWAFDTALDSCGRARALERGRQDVLVNPAVVEGLQIVFDAGRRAA